jgi:hypothetical protein
MSFRNPVIFICAFLSIVFSSCLKEGCRDPQALNYMPEAGRDDGSCRYEDTSVLIKSPSEGEVFQFGDIVPVEVEISGAEEIHGWALYLVNWSLEEPQVIWNNALHIHNESMTVSDEWLNEVLIDSEIELTVVAYLDHEGNTITTKVNFQALAL